MKLVFSWFQFLFGFLLAIIQRRPWWLLGRHDICVDLGEILLCGLPCVAGIRHRCLRSCLCIKHIRHYRITLQGGYIGARRGHIRWTMRLNDRADNSFCIRNIFSFLGKFWGPTFYRVGLIVDMGGGRISSTLGLLMVYNIFILYSRFDIS